jgi:GDPmannose 4,6-dehydratase
MWLMLQQEKPDDYVVATGETHSVREFVELAFKELGVEIEWHGEGQEEFGIDKANGNVIVKVHPRYYRPTEVAFLLGDPTKAQKKLNWQPKTKLPELLKIMIKADYEQESKQAK